MDQKGQYNISIVLFNSNIESISHIIGKLTSLQNLNMIYLVDNSPIKDDRFEKLNVNYDFVNENIGFGAGHNRAIKRSVENKIPFHFVINYDINFNSSVFDGLYLYMKENPSVGLVMPKILNYDGEIQILPKLIPSPIDVLTRALRLDNPLFEKRLNKYYLRFVQNDIIEVPIISGCFSLFRVDVFDKVGYYDERFFMYFEDFDISRRINENYKTVVINTLSIFHKHENGSRKKLSLFVIYLRSCIMYFNKWGWLIDKKRRSNNERTLKNLNLK